MTVVFFDFETGGVLPEHPDIQLAAIAVGPEWNELESFERKIRFIESKAEPEALKVNHYSAEAWKDAVSEAQVVAEFSAFLNRHRCIEMVSKRTGNPYSVARIAGHNAASFDGPRLKAMFERNRAFLPSHPQVMCTLQRAMWYAQEHGVRFESLRLEVLCKHFGIDLKEAHDALADVRGSIAIAKAMSEQKGAMAA